jgi:chromosome segregation protein
MQRRAEKDARAAAAAREDAEAALPPLREEEAIAAAVLQRLYVERDSMDAEATRAAETVASLEARIAQLVPRPRAGNVAQCGCGRDHRRAGGRGRYDPTAAMEGHADALAAAEAAAIAANDVLGEREGALARETELQADLAARHQAADRRIAEAQAARRGTKRRPKRRASPHGMASNGSPRSAAMSKTPAKTLQEATDLAARAEATLAETETARSEAEAQEAEHRRTRADAEGRAATLPPRLRP